MTKALLQPVEGVVHSRDQRYHLARKVALGQPDRSSARTNGRCHAGYVPQRPKPAANSEDPDRQGDRQENRDQSADVKHKAPKYCMNPLINLRSMRDRDRQQPGHTVDHYAQSVVILDASAEVLQAEIARAIRRCGPPGDLLAKVRRRY